MLGSSAVTLAVGRYLMNTEALDGLTTLASGSLLGSTICTLATATPSMRDSVCDSCCDTP